MSTPACREIDLAFKESEQKVSESLIKKKFKVANAYWGKVNDGGRFPMHSGTSIKGIRLGRVGVSNEHGWDQTSDSLCETDLCTERVPEVIHHGFDEYFYSLIRRSVRTDWLCINALALRQMPAEELIHFQSGIVTASKYLWDEVYRSRYIHMSDNKFVALVDAGTVCGDGTADCYQKSCSPDIRTSGFIFETRDSGEIDERFVRVNVDPADIARISEFTLDLGEEAVQQLEYDDENMPALEDGIDLFDLVLAHHKQGTRLAEQEDQQMNNAMSYGGHNAEFLKRKLGTKRVFRDTFSARYDIHSMRFYPDVTYNNVTLPTFGVYSPLDPTTWPRFQRVFAYKPADAGVAGVKYVLNSAYRWAPFGITTLFSPMVIEGLQFPDLAGVAGANKSSPGKELGYAGTATWYNPDWECNENREFGFWKLRFGVSIKPANTEFGFCWFHRIDHRVAVQLNCCDIRPAPCEEEISPYCGLNTGGDTEWDDFAPVAGGANLLIAGNSYV